MSESSSGSSGEEVILNPPLRKQISPKIRWCFTLNNFTKEEHSSILNVFRENAKKWILGDEIGEKGTPHIQGYVEFKKKVRPLSLFPNMKRIHWEGARGSPSENYDYCSKQKIMDIYGFPKPIKIIEKLYPWQEDIEKLYLEDPDDRKIHWYCEPFGNVGKSAFIKYMIVKHKVLFCSGGKYSDIMNLVFNQDMDECKAVFFDIPRAHKGCISYASLESIKNGMVCNTKYETGVKVFNSPHIFIFANFEPDDPDKLSKDRWIINKL